MISTNSSLAMVPRPVPQLSVVEDQPIQRSDLSPFRPFDDEVEQDAVKERQDRPYQIRVVGSVMEWRWRATLLISPAGSGKTVMGLDVAQQWYDQSPSNRKVVWMAMRATLLEQAEASHREFGYTVPIQYHSAMTAFKDRDPNYEYLLVNDEAHHVACETLVDNISAINPDYHLGLSATPYRADHATLGYIGAITDAGYNALLSEGYLAKYNHYQINEWTPEHVAATFLTDPEGWGKSLMFFKNSRECEICLELLTQAGIKAEFVNAKSDREHQLVRYENPDDVQVLISIQLLTEGFDAPWTKTVWTRDTESQSLQIQMSGRATRVWGDLVKRVVQSKKARYLFSATMKPEHRFVQGGDMGWEDQDAIVGYFQRRLANQDALEQAAIAQRKARAANSLVLRRRSVSY